MTECDHCKGAVKCGCNTCLRKAGLEPDVMKSRTVDCCFCKQARAEAEDKERRKDEWPEHIKGGYRQITYGRPQVDSGD